jgi:uncharacterized membrane protein
VRTCGALVTNVCHAVARHLLDSETCCASPRLAPSEHPIHPILVSLPIGLWTFALVCDFANAFGAAGPWATLSVYSIAGGIAGGVLAAVPGLIDYLSIDEPEMKRIGTTHLLVNPLPYMWRCAGSTL